VTCIIAHRDGWMAADRRETFQDALIGPYRTAKINRADGILVASSGSGVLMDLIREALEASGADKLRAVVQVFRDKRDGVSGHALALTPSGICEITSTGGLSWLDSDHWAIGSGYPFALGWLGAIAAQRQITPDDALNAINFAATRVNDVGDGIQVERL